MFNFSQIDVNLYNGWRERKYVNRESTFVSFFRNRSENQNLAEIKWGKISGKIDWNFLRSKNLVKTKSAKIAGKKPGQYFAFWYLRKTRLKTGLSA